MATFRKRNGKWNVRIRKKSIQGSISGTFFTKSEAGLWAADRYEARRDNQSPMEPRGLSETGGLASPNENGRRVLT